MMASEATNPGAEIKAGDRVRALDGAYRGRVGTAVRVVRSRDEGRTSETVLVSFPAGGADFLDIGVLEKAERPQE
jgi:hypothetical protein